MTTHTRTTSIRAALVTLLTIAIAATVAPAADAETARRNVAIDANHLRVEKVQETGLFSDGDEPYIAVIAYRGTLGVPGSTTTRFLGGLKELSTGAKKNRLLSIPDAMGRASFSQVVRRSATDLKRGVKPEIVGTVTMVMESDATPFSEMNRAFNRAAIELRKQLDPVISSMNPGSTGAQLGSRIASIAPKIRQAAMGSTGDRVRVFLRSWADPDDVIGFGVTGFVAVDDTLGASMESWITSQVPASLGTFGQLRNRTFDQVFSGDGARYRVHWAVTI
jgi:hypothetical protein